MKVDLKITCEKVAFDSKQAAQGRATEINKDKEVRRQGYTFSVYRCPHCLSYHLTKMDRSLARWINDIAYRNQVREQQFIQREVAYYNKIHRIRE